MSNILTFSGASGPRKLSTPILAATDPQGSNVKIVEICKYHKSHDVPIAI
jgi:hypothetical protein